MSNGEVEVRFLEEPKVGGRVTFMLEGQRYTSSEVTTVRTDPRFANRYFITTVSNNSYAGYLESPAAMDANRTAPVGPMAQPPNATIQGAPPPVYAPPPAYPPQTGYSPYPQPYAQDPGNTLSIIGIICGVISIFTCPLLLGLAGIILGIIGTSKREKLGPIAIAVSAVCMIIGIAVGVMIWSRLMSNFMPKAQ